MSLCSEVSGNVPKKCVETDQKGTCNCNQIVRCDSWAYFQVQESHFESNRTKFVKACEIYKGLYGSFGKRSCAAAKCTSWLGICRESGCSSSVHQEVLKEIDVIHNREILDTHQRVPGGVTFGRCRSIVIDTQAFYES